jgi:MFS family permease
MKFKLKAEHKALCCISLAWFLVLSGRYSISNLLPRIVNELNFSWTDAGIAMTLMWLFYAVVQFPSGIFSDIKGRKISILIAITIFSFSYLLVGLSINYLMFLLALLFLGLGTGGYPAVGISMITDIFRNKRGKALGIRDSAGSLAYAVPIFAAALASFYNWRIFFFVWSGICFISIYLFYIGTTESTTLPGNVSIKERVFDGIRIFRCKKIQFIFVINLFIAITWISYMSFGTLLIVRSYSIPLILSISFIPSLATAIFPVISSYLMDQWEEKGRGGKIGFYRSNLILLASPASTIIGVLADRYNFDVPFIGISILLFLSALIIFINILISGIRNEKSNLS